MRGTECDYHGSSVEPFRYGDRDFCWRCEADMMVAIDAVKRVRELHRPAEYDPTVCVECTRLISYQRPSAQAQYPCLTVEALDGGQS